MTHHLFLLQGAAPDTEPVRRLPPASPIDYGPGYYLLNPPEVGPGGTVLGPWRHIPPPPDWQEHVRTA